MGKISTICCDSKPDTVRAGDVLPPKKIDRGTTRTGRGHRCAEAAHDHRGCLHAFGRNVVRASVGDA